jgi:hypothetical protein
MSANHDHVDQLAAIIREVDGGHAKGAGFLAQAILSHPGSMWHLPDSLAQPEGEGPGLAKIDETRLLRVYCNARRAYRYDGPEHINWQRDAERGATLAGLGAVLARWGRPAAQPEGEGPSLAEVDELCAEFGFHCDDQGESLEILQEMIGAALTRWGRPAPPPAPELGEDAEDAVEFLNALAAVPPRRHYVAQARRAATLLQQQQLRIANLRSALADCGRAVGSLISGTCSDDFLLQIPVEVRLAMAKLAPAVVPGEQIAVPEQVTDYLRDHGTWLIQSGYANESTQTRDLGIRVFRAATLLKQFSLGGWIVPTVEDAAPAPAVVAVAWCWSDEFAHAMNHGGSFNGWRDSGAGANKCDMQLYTIPVPQAGEVES